MRLAEASLAAACLVQLFATAWGLPPPDQLLSNSPEIDNGFSGPPLHVYAQPALRKRQATTASTSAATSSGTSVSSSSSSSSSEIYTNSTTSSTMSSTSSSMSSSANLTTSSTTTSSTSSYANSTSSTASSTTSSSTTASASPTTIMGVTFNIQNNTIYSGTLLNLMRKRAADSGIDMCLNKCASNSSCQGTAYDNTTNTCTYYSSVDQSSQMTKNGTTFALVQNRASNTTSNSTTSVPSSSMTLFLVEPFHDKTHEYHFESFNDHDCQQYFEPFINHVVEYNIFDSSYSNQPLQLFQLRPHQRNVLSGEYKQRNSARCWSRLRVQGAKHNIPEFDFVNFKLDFHDFDDFEYHQQFQHFVFVHI
ncbi:hypothetical protein KCU78_g5798, partial [Aureobasidium melanogenum]